MLASCARLITSLALIGTLNLSAEEAPKWVSGPAEYCGPGKLCAVGEGTGQMSAAANARNEISRIFETRVESETTVSSSAKESNAGGVVAGELTEEMLSIIKDSTEGVLQGVVIEQNYESSDRYYALASLNRLKASEILAARMKDLDEKNVNLFEAGKRTDVYRILKNFELRERLNDRYRILRSGGYPSPLSYTDVMKKKALLRQNRTLVSVDIVGDEKKSALMPFVVALLLDMDFKITAPEQATFNIVGTWMENKEHFNVKGFEKYNFTFSLVAKNKSGVKVGGLSTQAIQTGRNLQQSKERALPTIKSEITETIDKLNIN